MTDDLTNALQQHFKHRSFRPLQREIIESVLSGAPTLAILPTGGGKSLTYQLPALLLEGVTVIISPLISLIQDQTQELLRKGLPVGWIDSTLSREDRQQQLRELRQGKVKLFYTSPESLANPELNHILKSLEISLVAIDEAHCISDWGHSFRPSYLYLPKLIRALNPCSILALTATATRKTAAEIRKLFRIKTAHQFSTSHKRANLKFRIIPCQASEKDAAMITALEGPERLPAIVYAMRQEQCEQVAHTLSQHGFKARSYHAGLHTKARAQIQNAFLNDEIDIVVATIAFGMGVDKPNIRSVIHYHLPKSPEGWMQESGRAGRDGKDSLCLLLACGDDLIPLENFIHAKEIRQKPLENLLQSLYSQGAKAEISPYHSRLQHDIQVSTFEILLARLEVAGHINYLGSKWRYIWSWPVAGRRLDLDSFPKKITSALQHIFSLGERYDTFDSEQDFGIKTAKLWEILYELRDQSDIVFKPSGWLWRYQIKKPKIDLSSILSPLLQSLTDQCQTDMDKLNQVESIATSRACIPNRLALWFGEKSSAPCGCCSSCLKEKRPSQLPRSKVEELTDAQLETIQDLLDSPKKRLRSNQQLTRFLCGIQTPYMRHFWLNRKSSFGMLSQHSYLDVHAYAKALLNADD